MNPAARAVTTAGPFRFEPATITASYPLCNSGGVYHVRSLLGPGDEMPRGARCSGEWLVRDRQGRALGALTDEGCPGPRRWAWSPIRPAREAYQGRADELARRVTTARSFPALLEQLTG